MSVWIQDRERNNIHDLCSKTPSREKSRTECGLLHNLCRPHQAFNTVSRDWLWNIMAKFGCLLRFIAKMRQFHDGMQSKMVDSSLEHFL